MTYDGSIKKITTIGEMKKALEDLTEYMGFDDNDQVRLLLVKCDSPYYRTHPETRNPGDAEVPIEFINVPRVKLDIARDPVKGIGRILQIGVPFDFKVVVEGEER